MRKFFVLFSVLTLSLLLTACGDKDKNCNPDVKFKVGLVTDTGGIDDKSFNQGTWEGIVRFSKAHDLCKDNYKYLQSNAEQDYEPNLTAMVEDKVDLIVAAGFLFEASLNEVAQAKPNAKFLLIDTVVAQPNVASAVFAEHEGSYLVGIAAALKAKAAGKNKVGFIGGMDFDVINRFHTGFEQGVKSVDENMTVVSDYIGTFEDESKAQNTASAMYDDGVYVIYTAAGNAGNGAIKEAKNRALQGKDVWVIGVDRDQYDDGIYDEANNKSVILTSMKKRVDVAAETVARQTYEGFFPGGQTLLFNLANDGVGIPSNNPNLSSEIIAKIMEAKAKILSGEIEVSDKLVK